MEQPIVSPDGAYIWNGKEWIPNEEYNFFSTNETEGSVGTTDFGTEKVSNVMFSEPPLLAAEIPPIPENIQPVSSESSDLEHSVLATNHSDESQHNDDDIVKFGTIFTVIAHISWLCLAIYTLIQVSEPNYDQVQVQFLAKLTLGLYVLSAISTFFVKFNLENNQNDNDGYVYLNSLSQKTLLIPFAILAIAIVVAFFILKILAQISIEASKQNSNRRY